MANSTIYNEDAEIMDSYIQIHTKKVETTYIKPKIGEMQEINNMMLMIKDFSK